MLITEKEKRLNIDIDKDTKLDVSVWKDVFGSHIKVGNRVIGDFPAVTKLDDYYYEITIDEMDEQYADEALKTGENIGGCSQFRIGNIIGRSYDWYYNNSVTFKIHVPAKEGRHASDGTAQCSITYADMLAENYDEALKVMPFQTLDGKNDAGVYCGTNVVPTGDYGITTGTNAGNKDLCQIFIPRFVLDNADSARHAIDLLSKMNIFAPNIRGHVQELHTMICDASSSYIVEFINNKMHVLSDQDDEFDNLPNDRCIMTNSYLSNWNGVTKAVYRGDSADEVAETGLTKHATGIERYDLLLAGIDAVNSVEKALELIKQVKYIKAYDASVNPYWYSELAEYFVDTGIYTTKEDMQVVADKMIALFPVRSRDDRKTWQSVHQAVYDLSEKTLKVVVQENGIEHDFEIV